MSMTESVKHVFAWDKKTIERESFNALHWTCVFTTRTNETIRLSIEGKRKALRTNELETRKREHDR